MSDPSTVRTATATLYLALLTGGVAVWWYGIVHDAGEQPPLLALLLLGAVGLCALGVLFALVAGSLYGYYAALERRPLDHLEATVAGAALVAACLALARWLVTAAPATLVDRTLVVTVVASVSLALLVVGRRVRASVARA